MGPAPPLRKIFFRPDGTPYTGRNNNVTDPSTVDWEHPLQGHATDHGFDVFKGLASSINFANLDVSADINGPNPLKHSPAWYGVFLNGIWHGDQKYCDSLVRGQMR